MVTYCLLVVFTLTFLLNTVVAAALYRARRLKPVLRVLLFNLALTDTLAGLVNVYHMVVANLILSFSFECLIRYGLVVELISVSLAFILLLSLDRVVSLVAALQYEQIVTEKRLWVISALSWLTMLVFPVSGITVFLIFVVVWGCQCHQLYGLIVHDSDVYLDGACGASVNYEDFWDNVWPWVDMSLFSLLPSFMLLVSNVALLRSLRRSASSIILWHLTGEAIEDDAELTAKMDLAWAHSSHHIKLLLLLLLVLMMMMMMTTTTMSFGRFYVAEVEEDLRVKYEAVRKEMSVKNRELKRKGQAILEQHGLAQSGAELGTDDVDVDEGTADDQDDLHFVYERMKVSNTHRYSVEWVLCAARED
nr:hypothetical protein BaRGS_005330 [Batillaria attramentaria]